MQFREACYTVVSYAPYILLQIYTITILATFGVTIFEFFHPGPQPIRDFVITCLEIADLLALLCVSFLVFCHFPMWCPKSDVVLDSIDF